MSSCFEYPKGGKPLLMNPVTPSRSRNNPNQQRFLQDYCAISLLTAKMQRTKRRSEKADLQPTSALSNYWRAADNWACKSKGQYSAPREPSTTSTECHCAVKSSTLKVAITINFIGFKRL